MAKSSIKFKKSEQIQKAAMVAGEVFVGYAGASYITHGIVNKMDYFTTNPTRKKYSGLITLGLGAVLIALTNEHANNVGYGVFAQGTMYTLGENVFKGNKSDFGLLGLGMDDELGRDVAEIDASIATDFQEVARRAQEQALSEMSQRNLELNGTAEDVFYGVEDDLGCPGEKRLPLNNQYGGLGDDMAKLISLNS